MPPTSSISSFIGAFSYHDGGDEVEGDKEEVSKVISTSGVFLQKSQGVVTGKPRHTAQHHVLPVLSSYDTQHEDHGKGEAGKVVVLRDAFLLGLVYGVRR